MDPIPPPPPPPPTQSLRVQDFPANIEDIMHTAYLQYSLSVNVGRAIPDVRDGLKPVNRRILYAMRMQGLTKSHAYSKCATVVGEVIGHYHPHGDQSVYDALVRMAQPFSMRYPLIDGQGNFGSIDGDAPAAYRYTECRMERLAEELMQDLDKETCDFRPNFSEDLNEPVVLPAGYPNLLVNGSTGIGVGMATSIPPHNLGEIIDATLHLIDFPRTAPRELMRFVKGPDFPTGASIVGLAPVMQLYETGHGIISVRGKARIEEMPDGRERIIVTEIPYMLNKESLVAKIAELVNDKVITGISDLRDESSSRAGIRIVAEVKRNEMAAIVLNQMYRHSPLQTSIGCQFLVVDQDRPRTLNLTQMLQAYIDHRLEVITRRCKYELRQAEARAHIVEGLIIAVNNIDEVVKIIRGSRTREDAAATLAARFQLSKRQITAILELRLHQLTGLAIDELRAEFAALVAEITRLKELLASRELRMGVVKAELQLVRDKYADPRRTEVVMADDDINLEDIIQKHVAAITVSNTGYIKRQPVDAFKVQRRGGVGVVGMQTKEEDYVEHLFSACSHDYLLFFTNQGRMYWLKVYEIPEATRTSRGKAIVNLIAMEEGEQIRAMLTVPKVDVEDLFLVFCTHFGTTKKTRLSDFKHMRKVGIRALNLDEGDDLIEVKLLKPGQQVMIFTATGMACRFVADDEQLRPLSRDAAGVRGIRLREGDKVVAMEIVDPQAELLCITKKGMGKRTNIGTGISELDEATGGGYRLTSRGGYGVTGIRLKEDDELLAALRVEAGDEIIMTSKGGQVVRINLADIRTIGRASQGVQIIKLREGDSLAGAAKIPALPDTGEAPVEGAAEGATESAAPATGEGPDTAAGDSAAGADASPAPAQP